MLCCAVRLGSCQAPVPCAAAQHWLLPVTQLPLPFPPVPSKAHQCHPVASNAIAPWPTLPCGKAPSFLLTGKLASLDCCWSLSAPACLVPAGLHHKQLVSSINQWPDPAETTSSGAVAWPPARLSSCICSPRQHLAWNLGHSFPHRQPPGWPRLGVHSEEAVSVRHVGRWSPCLELAALGALPLLEPLCRGWVGCCPVLELALRGRLVTPCSSVNVYT